MACWILSLDVPTISVSRYVGAFSSTTITSGRWTKGEYRAWVGRCALTWRAYPVLRRETTRVQRCLQSTRSWRWSRRQHLAVARHHPLLRRLLSTGHGVALFHLGRRTGPGG